MSPSHGKGSRRTETTDDANGRHGLSLDPNCCSYLAGGNAAAKELSPTELNEAGALGHPYRLRIDFDTGRYAFCKVGGRPGEGATATQQIAPVPPACGGG